MGQSRPIAVDLFAGAGGMSLGFEQAGFDVLAAVEIDAIHCATHAYNFPWTTIFCCPVGELRGQAIRDHSAIGDREIDVVFGGPPCQGFSLMGQRRMGDPRNSLLEHFVRLVLELKPQYFVMENVPGLLVGEHRQWLEHLLQPLFEQHYQIEPDYRLLNAAHFGIPQKRKRLFLLGCRLNLPLPSYPAPSHAIPQRDRPPNSPPNSLPAPPTVQAALQDLPEVTEYPELLSQDWVKAKFGAPSPYAQLLRDPWTLSPDYTYRRAYDPTLLTASIRTQHSPETITRFSQLALGRVDPISHFYKLAPEGLCNTLRAGTDEYRGSFTSPRPIHYASPRCITVREAARLHSYPDWFRFHVTKWHGFRQVGNSVPPRLAKAIAQEIIKVLAIIPHHPHKSCPKQNARLLQLKPNQARKYWRSLANISTPQGFFLGE